MEKKYIAHKTEEGKEQLLIDHLRSTAELAMNNAIAPCKSITHAIGLAHDIGKYSNLFQKRINGSNVKVEHAICGAKEYKDFLKDDFFAPIIEYCIAGHHSGLPDGGTRVDMPDTSTLSGRLKRKTEDFSFYKQECKLETPQTEELMKFFRNIPKTDKKHMQKECLELYYFFTKYIFSCLTDADFIDTEKFCNPNADRGYHADFIKALSLLNEKILSFKKDTEVRKSRNSLLQQAVLFAENKDFNIGILNMPTGSGKTLCSLKIALEKVIKNNKKRIIYVIPYTSIIEQTADTFSSILGDSIPILQHHSNYDFDNDEEDPTTIEKMKRSCENWDAPLIITTSVQFFQSLYHYKGRGLRKMHNLSDSVIIFDEIHLIPINLLQPCIRGIGNITKYLNSISIFLSATMPSYDTLFKKFIPSAKISDLIENKEDFNKFKNCIYKNLGETTFENIAYKIQDDKNSLIIVNKRKSAQALYKMVQGKKFHLSTYMMPEHRSKVISEIKQCLKKEEKVTVVSTSLVEAGVDFDFENVYRELSGLDSILQSGGRCNREGKLKYGNVFVFETDEKIKNGDMAMRANIAQNLIKEYSDINSDDCIKDYYNRLFGYNEEKIEDNSISKYAEKNASISLNSIPFRSYSEQFEYIKKGDTIGIVINVSDEVNTLLEKLKYGDFSVKRKLQKYTVSVYIYEFDEIFKLGLLNNYNNVYALDNIDFYDKDIGLSWKNNQDENYII